MAVLVVHYAVLSFNYVYVHYVGHHSHSNYMLLYYTLNLPNILRKLVIDVVATLLKGEHQLTTIMYSMFMPLMFSLKSARTKITITGLSCPLWTPQVPGPFPKCKQEK